MITDQRISSRSLLRKAFAAIGSIYVPLLLISSPTLIFALLNSLVNLGSAGVALNIIYLFCAVPFLSGVMIFYIYRNLTGNQVTVGAAFKQANRRLLQLIVANIPNFMFWLLMPRLLVFVWEKFSGSRFDLLMCASIPNFMWGLLVLAGGFIVLMMSVFYVAYRLIFVFYAIVIDNTSALDSFRNSWKLTKSGWWLMCRSMILLFFMATVAILIMLLMENMGLSLVMKPGDIVLKFLFEDVVAVYLVVFYLNLRDSAATIK